MLTKLEQGNAGKLRNDVFETSYLRVSRAWSDADTTVWIDFCTSCCLGCADCHEYAPQPARWLTPTDLEERLWAINRGRPAVITVALGDPFLSPHLEKLIQFTRVYGHRLVLYSYFPRLISLGYVGALLLKFPHVSVSYSLHGLTDEYRETRFWNPHPIESILTLLANPPMETPKHRVYIFSHLVTPTLGWMDLFRRCREQEISVALQGYIDYARSEIWVPLDRQYPGVKVCKPRRDFLGMIYDRPFTEVSQADAIVQPQR